MSKQDQFYTVVDDRNRTTREFVDLKNENARLREAIKLAMHEIAAKDYDEAYHQLYKGLDPNFEKLDVHN
jgi:hypothetical protein